MSQYGLTEWNNLDIKTGGANKQQARDLFLKLQNGDNIVRIITKPHEYLVHRFKAHKDDPGFGERILSPKPLYGSDPIEEMGFKPQRRWLVGVIDRKTQSYKILDLSIAVLKSIQQHVRDEDWGDPSQYDFNVKVDKQGGPTGYYSVVAKPKKPLSAADLEIKQSVDLEDLKRRCTPPTVEQVRERVQAIQAKSPNFAGATTAAAPESVEDDDTDFPSAD